MPVAPALSVSPLEANRDALRSSLATDPADVDGREPLWRERFRALSLLDTAIAEHKRDTGDLVTDMDHRLYASVDAPHVAIAQHKRDTDDLVTDMDERLYEECRRILGRAGLA